jgi:hypothetical protein
MPDSEQEIILNNKGRGIIVEVINACHYQCNCIGPNKAKAITPQMNGAHEQNPEVHPHRVSLCRC